MKKQPFKWRFFLLNWHRRIGLVAALFVLVLAATGILINHANDLALDVKPLPASIQRSVYNIKLNDREVGFQLDQNWLSQHAGKLFFNTTELSDCTAPLLAAIAAETANIAVCTDAVIYFSAQGELIEKASQPPADVKRVGVKSGQLFIETPTGAFELNAETTEWKSSALPEGLSWLAAQPLPDTLQEQLGGIGPAAELTWERFLLDLHSGRMFSHAGIFTADATGLMLILLACSGSWLILSKPRRKS